MKNLSDGMVIDFIAELFRIVKLPEKYQDVGCFRKVLTSPFTEQKKNS